MGSSMEMTHLVGVRLYMRRVCKLDTAEEELHGRNIFDFAQPKMPASSVSPREYSMKYDGVEKNILNYMNQERKLNGGSSCEVILRANGIKHYAHKVVLVSFSDFFRSYFEEKAEEESLNGKESSAGSEKDSEKYDDEIVSLKSDATNESSENVLSSAISRSQVRATIDLPGINPEELGPILDYMYTSQLLLREDNVNEILLVGCLLQISSVMEFCAEVLLKQPTWRSPLVSSKLFNYVANRAVQTQRDDVASSSPTAVTWATSGVRPVSHEIKPRSRRRNATSNAQHDDSNRPAGPSGHSRSAVAPSRGSRKRRHPDSRSWSSQEGDAQKGRRIDSTGRGLDVASVITPTMEKQQQEFLADIDFAELDRELTRNAQLMNSRRYQSQGFDITPFSSTAFFQKSAPPPLVDVRSRNAKQETQISSGADRRASGMREAKHLEPRHRLSRDEVDVLQARKHPVENQTVAMFPQLSDCNRNLAAALCFPMFHPSYFGFPSVNHISRLGYPSTFPGIAYQGPAYEKYPDNRKVGFLTSHANRLEENIAPHRAFAASIAGIYGNPAQTQMYDKAESDAAAVTCRLKADLHEIHTSIHQDILSLKTKTASHLTNFNDGQYRPGVSTGPSCHLGFKRFCPDIIQHMNSYSDEEKNISREPRDLWVDLNGSLNAGKQQKITPSNSGESGFSFREERNKETCGTPTAVQSHSHSDMKVRKEDKVDYHKRKRKLLRAAEELPNNEKTKQAERYVSNKPTRDTPKVLQRKTKCSSEDDIIARECHHSDASDLDSDDSGRPSSV